MTTEFSLFDGTLNTVTLQSLNKY